MFLEYLSDSLTDKYFTLVGNICHSSSNLRHKPRNGSLPQFPRTGIGLIGHFGSSIASQIPVVR